MVPENEDFLVMQQLKEGKESAFHTLFKKYFSVLTLYAYKILKDEDAARDVVQAVFTKVYEQRETLEIRVSIKSFLYQSVRNRSLNELKSQQIKKRHHDIIFVHSSELGDDGDSFMEEAELEMKVVHAIGKLPGQCRKIFEMSRMEGMTNSEIAEDLNLSKRTVETQISKALKTLRAQLQEFFPAFLFIMFLNK